MEDQDQKIVNRMFKKQRNLLLVALLSMVISGFIMGSTIIEKPITNLEVSSDLSWEKLYYDMKRQRDSMKIERDDIEKKFEESVRYWQQCESKLNK
jgi:hypothetical protein